MPGMLQALGVFQGFWPSWGFQSARGEDCARDDGTGDGGGDIYSEAQLLGKTSKPGQVVPLIVTHIGSGLPVVAFPVDVLTHCFIVRWEQMR